MAYESRQDKEPTAAFFAQVEATWRRAWPHAQIDRSTMEALKPFLVAVWRRGYTAKTAATTACSCDGKKITPSPTTDVHLPKGAVRPPKGAGRGAVFAAEELRPPRHAERLLREIAVQQEAIEREQGRAEKASGAKAAAHRAKAAELGKVLSELKKRLETEWPEGERYAPALYPQRKPKKEPKPRKERPKKEPKAKVAKPQKEPKAKAPKAKKEPKAKVAKPQREPKAKAPKAKKEPKAKVAKAPKPKVEKVAKPKKEPKVKMDKPKKEPPPPKEPAAATPSPEDKAALDLLEQLMSNRAAERAGKK